MITTCSIGLAITSSVPRLTQSSPSPQRASARKLSSPRPTSFPPDTRPFLEDLFMVQTGREPYLLPLGFDQICHDIRAPLPDCKTFPTMFEAWKTRTTPGAAEPVETCVV